ncbi:hypothetical protein KI387_001761, partial [Taxus chinensis]
QSNALPSFFESGTMLHQTNLVLETDQNYYFMNTSLKIIEHIDNTTVTANPINSCKSELEMSSIGKLVEDDDASAIVHLSNCGVADLDISSFRKSKANDILNNDCEFSIDAKFTKSIVDERLTSLKLVNVSDFEVCTTSLCQPIKKDSNMLSLSTTQKPDFPKNAVTASDDIVTETGTCISCSLENDGHIVRDIHVYDGTTSRDKLPIVSGCSVVTEELPKFITLMENEMNFHEYTLGTIANQLKTIKVKDHKNIPEGYGASVVKGLTEESIAQLHQDDKHILEESFILHSSSFKEKHVSNTIDWDENVEHGGIGSRLEDHVNQPSSLSSDKMENILNVPAEDDNKYRKLGTISTAQKENILAIPERNDEKESVHDSNSHAECLDVRLESSSATTHCVEDSPVETLMGVQFYGDNDSRVDSLSFKIRSEGCVASHVIFAGETSRLASDESHSIEGSTQNGRISMDKDEFPNGETLSGRDLCTRVDNSLLQAAPFLVSEREHGQAAAGLNFASVGLTGGLIVNSSSSDLYFSADSLLSKSCSQVAISLLVPERMDKLLDNFSSNHGLGQEDSRIGHKDSRGETVVASEQKLTVDDQILPVSLHPVKESTKICNLTEKNLIDPDVVNYDTANKSAGDNIPASGLVSINADLNIKTENQGHEIDSGFLGHPVIEGKTEESIEVAEHRSIYDDQDTLPLTRSRKEGDGTSEITEKLLIDAKTTDGSTSEKSVVNNMSGPTVAESDTKSNAWQKGFVTSGFSEDPVSSAYAHRNSHESFSGHSVSCAYAGRNSHDSISGHPVSSAYDGQNSHDLLSEAFDDNNGHNDLADSSCYTYSGPISGPIPFSGNISLRSDSSTTSTRSFAFP